MCGFAGFWDRGGALSGDAYPRVVASMADELRTRGPDDGHAWTARSSGIALGFRRLSIVDLSESGRQPMVSSRDDLVIVYNGEIYNAPELRDELRAEGARFRGHSDTEVLLEACSRWGVERAVQRLIGMFAFALWDRVRNRVTLVRDRLGIKPLYWARSGNAILFASQPRCFFRFPGWQPRIDRESLCSYTRFGYVPAPGCIYEDTWKLMPGEMITFGDDGVAQNVRYWKVLEAVTTGKSDPFVGSEQEAEDALADLLADAVRRRMIADVPLGAFLSGGVDSSTVVALMQAQSATPVKTFSIGFHESQYNEAPFARAIAGHLGTEHHELYAEPAHALEVVPEIPEWYDEPFSDSSQIPTFLVSEMTREHVTVALSGDGGDELFAGYARYAYARRLATAGNRVPRALRQLLARVARALPEKTWSGAGALLPGRLRGSIAARWQLLTRDLDPKGRDELYRSLVSLWHDPSSLVLGSREPRPEPWSLDLARVVPDDTERMQVIDLLSYLPDDILTKVDRASMAVSLEARVPLLDHRVVEFVWRLPSKLRTRPAGDKWLLRRVLYRYVPEALVERPKMGFGVPIDSWLRGPLREWAEDLLSERRLREDGYFDPAPIREKWEAHLAGRVDWHYPLWTILSFQAWKARWLHA